MNQYAALSDPQLSKDQSSRRKNICYVSFLFLFSLFLIKDSPLPTPSFMLWARLLPCVWPRTSSSFYPADPCLLVATACVQIQSLEGFWVQSVYHFAPLFYFWSRVVNSYTQVTIMWIVHIIFWTRSQGCLTIKKQFNLPNPFLHQQNCNKNSICYLESFWGLNDIIQVKHCSSVSILKKVLSDISYCYLHRQCAPSITMI